MGKAGEDGEDKQTKGRGHLPAKKEGDLRGLDVVEEVHEDTDGGEYDSRVVVVQA